MESVGRLPNLNALLSSIISPSSDDQKYILIPLILEVLAAHYKHQDAVFTLNEYIAELNPEYTEATHESLLRY